MQARSDSNRGGHVEWTRQITTVRAVPEELDY